MTTKMLKPSAKGEAARLLAIIVKVNRLRAEILELAADPYTGRLMKLSHYSDVLTEQDISELDIPLRQIVDGAALAYAKIAAR